MNRRLTCRVLATMAVVVLGVAGCSDDPGEPGAESSLSQPSPPSEPANLDDGFDRVAYTAAFMCGDLVVVVPTATGDGLYDATTGDRLDVGSLVPDASADLDPSRFSIGSWMCVPTGVDEVIALSFFDLDGVSEFTVGLDSDGEVLWSQAGLVEMDDTQSGGAVAITGAPGRVVVDALTGRVLHRGRGDVLPPINPTDRQDRPLVGNDALQLLVLGGDLQRVYASGYLWREDPTTGYLQAYDAHTGAKVWETDVPYYVWDDNRSWAFDAEHDVAVWYGVDPLRDYAFWLYAVAARSGEPLWSRPFDGRVDVDQVRAGGGLVMHCRAPGPCRPEVLDSQTGQRLLLPDGLRPLDVGTTGLLAVGKNGAMQVLSRSELEAA